jgi:hypothetical protein
VIRLLYSSPGLVHAPGSRDGVLVAGPGRADSSRWTQLVLIHVELRRTLGCQLRGRLRVAQLLP